MATVYVTAFVPDAARAVAEGAIASYLTGPGAIFTLPLVPVGDPAATPPTHWGCCVAMSDTGETFAALSGLSEAIPGSQYAVVSPWRSFRRQTHWVDWLAGFSLQQQVIPQS